MALHDLRMELLGSDSVDGFIKKYKECWTAVEEAAEALPDHAAEAEETIETRKTMRWALRCFIPKIRDHPDKVAKVLAVYEEFPVDLN